MLNNQVPRITDQFLKHLLSSDRETYFETRSLNKKLFIHFKGFKRLENLEQFTGLKVLYAEGNSLEKIENLENCPELRCLYLQDNQIKEMSGIENLSKLHSINLSGNLIEKIECLEYKPCLTSLLLQRNLIGKGGISDLEELFDLEKLSVLDLSFNLIDSWEVLEKVIFRLQGVTVLYFQGNPICGKMKNYRKEMIFQMPQLKFLDERPVFDDERRFAEAFGKNGIAGERLERAKWEEEKRQEKENNHLAFKEMIERRRMAGRIPESTSESLQETSSQNWSSSTDEEGSACEEERKIVYDDVE
jgi:dynein assembly factor 1